MNITNLKELEERETLEEGDKVYFTVGEDIIEYEVYSCYLNSSLGNDIVFESLGIKGKELAEKAYGYPLNRFGGHGLWPYYKDNDYISATRLVKELYKIIEEKYHEKIDIPVYSRWELLDL